MTLVTETMLLKNRRKAKQKLPQHQVYRSEVKDAQGQESDLSACEILLTLKKHPAP